MAEQHGKTLVPQIRFAGFTDPWEQRKLGELFEESDERASDREILSVSVANGIYPASESDRETNPGASLANYKVVHSGDVVYNSMRMWQGAVDASRYDGIVSPAYVVAKPNSEVYARFFARLLRQPMLLKQYQQVSQGNSKDTQVLKFDDFASIEISMPASENEQRQIGAFFDRLDSLITLHQRKYDKLCVLKKSMLDKMFPKGGSLYPEIRFAGFTDPWEQRKLGELTEIKDSARIPNRLWREAGVPYIRASDISQEDLRGALFIDEEDYAAYKAATGAPEKGDVLFNGGGEIGKAIINGNSSPIYVQGGAVLYARIAHSSLLDARYLVAAFVTQNVVNAIGVLSAGGTMKHFTLQPAKNLPIEVPSIAEQRRIGAFFDRLDSLITLHQRKYDGCANPLFLERRISCRKPSHQNRCSATTTPSG